MNNTQTFYERCAGYDFIIVEYSDAVRDWCSANKYLWKRVIKNYRSLAIIWDVRENLYAGRKLEQRGLEEPSRKFNVVAQTGEDLSTYRSNSSGPMSYLLLTNELPG